MNIEIKPIETKTRIEILDVIRGFAIFGILIANIQSWSGYKFVPPELLETLPYYDYNQILKYLFMFFIDTKFYTLFSLLFGIGFYLQFNKYKDKQNSFIQTYRRRLGFLMMFGAIHSFFWAGDILLVYGAVGLVFVFFRNISNSKILILSIFFYFSSLLYDPLLALFFSDTINTLSTAYPNMHAPATIPTFQNATFFETLQSNWYNLYHRYIHFIPTGRLTKVLALFLLGYYLMRINYFSKYAKSLKVLAFFFSIGIISTYLSRELGGSMGQWSHDIENVMYKFLASSGQVLLALSYINILAILDDKLVFKKSLHFFTYVGRMSFTNYLSQTLIGFLIFYPYFGGLFGTMGLVEITLLAITIYVLQILFSFIWLKYFVYGPLEWVWRCLTNKKFYPILQNTKV